MILDTITIHAEHKGNPLWRELMKCKRSVVPNKKRKLSKRACRGKKGEE